MDAARRAAEPIRIRRSVGAVGTAGVIEDRDPVRAGRLGEQRFELAVVDAGDGLVVVEIVDGGLVAHQQKPLAVEGEQVRDLPHVAHVHTADLGLEVHPGFASGERGALEVGLGVLGNGERQRPAHVVGAGGAAGVGRGRGLVVGHGFELVVSCRCEGIMP